MATASIWVPLPPSKVWPWVCNPDHFSQFMSHIRQVRSLGDGLWEWQLSGLLGIPIFWQTRSTTEGEMHQVWQSTPGPLKTKGFMVAQAQNGGSLITLHHDYQPPAGALEAMFAQLFTEPQKMLEDDLKKLDKLIMQQATQD